MKKSKRKLFLGAFFEKAQMYTLTLTLNAISDDDSCIVTITNVDALLNVQIQSVSFTYWKLLANSTDFTITQDGNSNNNIELSAHADNIDIYMCVGGNDAFGDVSLRIPKGLLWDALDKL